tara:strand:- start:197 stop:880 length:684 start_codon:yes stop_codon:yes gene_type:complete
MELTPENCNLVSEFIHQMYPDMEEGFGNGVTYESINLTEGYELFSKEFFETEFEKFINSKSWVAFRNERDKKLSETDWTQTNDIGLENEEEWVAHRQALRDLPANTQDPINPVWPEQPQVKIVQEKNTRTELSDIKTELKADLSGTKADLQTIQTQLNTHTHPLEEHTHPLEEHTHPLEPHTHPLKEHTHPEIAIEKAKTHELQQRLTLIEHSHAALVARLEALENI